ncbi:MAG TPA: polymer-forming cytoskeletal protein [Planctomycetota bacterium]|nr:polymer-forming cytoskeletal protein [Planctomycetota bacterium]
MSWGKRKEALTKGQSVDTGTDLATLDVPDTFFDTTTLDTRTEDTPDTTTDGTTETTTETTTATIGPTLCLQGELTGNEDVTIDGKVEGRIEVPDYTVTIGPNANIKATIVARCVVIQGKVVGDIEADEKVEIEATGSLIGDIRASRVVLAESARFRGRIDMGWDEQTQTATTTVTTTATAAAHTTTRSAREAATTPTTTTTTASAHTTARPVRSLGALDWDRPTTRITTEPKSFESTPGTKD